MSNRALTADVIATSALAILDNELGVLDTFYRAPEDEFASEVNGYKKGSTISIRRPADFTIRSGSVMDVQDAIEGKVSFAVDKQKGVDFQFTSTDLTLSISKLSERFIKPAMINLVNEIAADCMEAFYPYVYNWVGTAGNVVDSFADFYKAPERLNEMAVPTASRYAVLSPADHAGMLGNLTGLYIAGDAKSAYRNGTLGNIGGVDVMMSQVVPTHANGTADNTTPLTRGTSNTTTYDSAKDTWTMTLSTDGWDASATITAGTVFTIGTGSTGVYMVNPKTKRSTGILQQFVVTAAVTADGTTSNETQLTISPPIIVSGPHQTVNAAPGNDVAITVVGSASTSYKQNLVYHKNAFALAMVPMELPQGAYNAARKTQNGISVRVIPVFDGINDISKWRLDVLYGRKLIDPRLATRLSGT
jgi:hypothetical protein